MVAARGTHEQRTLPDLIFDPAASTWHPLPTDPLAPGYYRTMVWAPPYLYLFDHELVPNPGAVRPPVTRAARLGLGTRRSAAPTAGRSATGGACTPMGASCTWAGPEPPGRRCPEVLGETWIWRSGSGT